ncbi:hypothetical protein Ancab_037643 [Ancistrocladus abbreviatus]
MGRDCTWVLFHCFSVSITYWARYLLEIGGIDGEQYQIRNVCLRMKAMSISLLLFLFKALWMEYQRGHFDLGQEVVWMAGSGEAKGLLLHLRRLFCSCHIYNSEAREMKTFYGQLKYTGNNSFAAEEAS